MYNSIVLFVKKLKVMFLLLGLFFVAFAYGVPEKKVPIDESKLLRFAFKEIPDYQMDIDVNTKRITGFLAYNAMYVDALENGVTIVF